MKDAAGKPLGLSDAGQGWHTDMSYSKEIALANVLHAKRVPRRNGRVLGCTQFRNMHAAYDDLPAEVKARIDELWPSLGLEGKALTGASDGSRAFGEGAGGGAPSPDS